MGILSSSVKSQEKPLVENFVSVTYGENSRQHLLIGTCLVDLLAESRMRVIFSKKDL